MPYSLFPRMAISTTIPYTTLFRSYMQEIAGAGVGNTGLGMRGGWIDQRAAKIRDWVRGAVLPQVRLEITTNARSEEHTSELQSKSSIVCRLLLEKKKGCAVLVRWP